MNFLLIINCGLCFILCYLHSWAFGLWCHLQVSGLVYICLTVYEFSFILLIHHIILLILISVLSVTFWTLTYYKIFIFFDHVLFDMKLLNYLFCDMFGSVLECYELTHISWLSTPWNHAWLNRHCYPIGCVIKSTHQGICSCSPIVNFFKFTFHHRMAASVIFLIKKII